MSIVKGVFMIRRRYLMIHVVLTAALLLLAATLAVGAETVPRLSTDELKARLGEPGLKVLDVRGSWDWNGSADKIPGAERVNPAQVDQWAGNLSRQETLVLYCA